MVGASERERLQRKPGRRPQHRHRPVDLRLASTCVTRTHVRIRRATMSSALNAARQRDQLDAAIS